MQWCLGFSLLIFHHFVCQKSPKPIFLKKIMFLCSQLLPFSSMLKVKSWNHETWMQGWNFRSGWKECVLCTQTFPKLSYLGTRSIFFSNSHTTVEMLEPMQHKTPSSFPTSRSRGQQKSSASWLWLMEKCCLLFGLTRILLPRRSAWMVPGTWKRSKSSSGKFLEMRLTEKAFGGSKVTICSQLLCNFSCKLFSSFFCCF